MKLILVFDLFSVKLCFLALELAGNAKSKLGLEATTILGGLCLVEGVSVYGWRWVWVGMAVVGSRERRKKGRRMRG